jgi:biotin operon repressor
VVNVVNVFRELISKRDTFSDDKNKFKLQILSALGCVKDELDDHIDTINEDTNEIQSNFEYLRELDQKVEKLNEKIDMIFNILRQEKIVPAEKKFSVKRLTKKEKDVFYALYTLTESRTYVTYKEIAQALKFTESLVANYVGNLIEKGIPVLKKYSERIVYIGVEKEFRDVQAKENIVGITAPLTHWM